MRIGVIRHIRALGPTPEYVPWWLLNSIKSRRFFKAGGAYACKRGRTDASITRCYLESTPESVWLRP